MRGLCFDLFLTSPKFYFQAHYKRLKSFCVFFCVVFFFFLCFVFFYFFKISKFALPGVMLIYERTSIDRKKKKKKKKKKGAPYLLELTAIS